MALRITLTNPNKKKNVGDAFKLPTLLVRIDRNRKYPCNFIFKTQSTRMVAHVEPLLQHKFIKLLRSKSISPLVKLNKDNYLMKLPMLDFLVSNIHPFYSVAHKM